MNNSNNSFIGMINEKISKPFPNLIKYLKHRRKLNKFKKAIDRGSPDFALLCEMADFVKIAEVVFFYNNSPSANIYSSQKMTNPNCDGFRINHSECKIVVDLFKRENKVKVELERTTGIKVKTVQEFKDSQWITTPDVLNELLLEQTIKIINSTILELFDWCYSKA